MLPPGAYRDLLRRLRVQRVRLLLQVGRARVDALPVAHDDLVHALHCAAHVAHEQYISLPRKDPQHHDQDQPQEQDDGQDGRRTAQGTDSCCDAAPSPILYRNLVKFLLACPPPERRRAGTES